MTPTHAKTSYTSEYPHQRFYARFGVPPWRRGESIRWPPLSAFCVGPQRTINMFRSVFADLFMFVGWEFKFQFSRSISTIFQSERPKFSPSRLQFSFLPTQQINKNLENSTITLEIGPETFLNRVRELFLVVLRRTIAMNQFEWS